MSTPLDELATVVQGETGMQITRNRHPALQAAMARAAPDLDLGSALRQLRDPQTGPALLSSLIEEVTVKETYFLRDRVQLERIDWHSLLAHARAGGIDRVSVWSVPCATGEEAYTLALLACEAFATARPPVRILATDISSTALDTARAGLYGPRSTRELDPGLRRRYFHEASKGLVVDDSLRSLVTFQRHNLVANTAPPPGFDPFQLILCRNILIYFDGATVEQVLIDLEGALQPHGVLMLGAADALCATAGRLKAFASQPAGERPARQTPGTLRRPLGRLPVRGIAHELELIAQTAGAADSDEVISRATSLLAQDPLNAVAHFLCGLVQLETGDPTAAVRSLRRALFSEPKFGLAAFKLGCAYESLDDPAAAQRAYAQALRTLHTDDPRHQALLGQINVDDLAAAVRVRLEEAPLKRFAPRVA